MALATQLEPGEELSREDAPVSSGFRCACTGGHVAPVLLSITAKEGADQMKKNGRQAFTCLEKDQSMHVFAVKG